MDDGEIIKYLVKLLEDNRLYNGPHYNMLNELCERFDIEPSRLLELYRQAQQIWKEKHQ